MVLSMAFTWFPKQVISTVSRMLQRLAFLIVVSSLEWDGILFLRRGLYQGGKFRFTLIFSGDFPISRPDFFFNSKVYHPLVNPDTGKLDLEVSEHQNCPIIEETLFVLVFVANVEIWTGFHFHHGRLDETNLYSNVFPRRHKFCKSWSRETVLGIHGWIYQGSEEMCWR